MYSGELELTLEGVSLSSKCVARQQRDAMRTVAVGEGYGEPSPWCPVWLPRGRGVEETRAELLSRNTPGPGPLRNCLQKQRRRRLGKKTRTGLTGLTGLVGHKSRLAALSGRAQQTGKQVK